MARALSLRRSTPPTSNPTFPAASLGFRARARLANNLTSRAVVADGVPGDPDDPEGTEVILHSEDGALVTIEAAYYVGKPEFRRKALKGRVAELP